MGRFIPKKVEKEVISIRIPSELLQKVDRKSGEFDISRNELIVQCIEFALSHIEEEK